MGSLGPVLGLRAAGLEVERLSPWLEAARREAARRARHLGHPVLVTVTVGLPPFDPLDAFERAPTGEGHGWDVVLWARPLDGAALVGWGTALALTGRGPERFREIGQAWRQAIDEAVIRSAAADGPAGSEQALMAAPVALGGFAFDAGGSTRQPGWADFPDALMAVPRVLLGRRGDVAWLSLSDAVGPDGEPWDAAGRAGSSGAAGGGEGQGDGSFPPGPSAQGEDVREWAGRVEAAKAAIRSGQLAKVVLARAVDLSAGRPFDLAAVLAALWRDYPECHLFALRRRGSAFVGATPEPLVGVRGREVRSAILAGSTARGLTQPEDRRLAEELLRSPKERQEHAVVRDALLEALSQACTDVRAPERPEVLRLPTIQHLCTPVTARLREGWTLLDLVERLHPTPAVGGWPKAPALDWIRRHEGLDRGWYAGPVGWMDAAGSGEFAVAIRSALVRGSRATLFAGCGIMADSDPEREYRESWLKLRPMLQALQGPSRG